MLVFISGWITVFCPVIFASQLLPSCRLFVFIEVHVFRQVFPWFLSEGGFYQLQTLCLQIRKEILTSCRYRTLISLYCLSTGKESSG